MLKLQKKPNKICNKKNDHNEKIKFLKYKIYNFFDF